MKKLDEITLADLMPDSISGDSNVSATAGAIDPQLRAISEAVDMPLILAAIDTLPEAILEHLAVQYDLTSWDSAWPIGTKRAVLKSAIADKRKMGTRGAVQRAIEAVAPLATITEWWQTDPKGTPHTFTIDVLQDGSAVDAETQRNVIAQVNEAKPARSHYTFGVRQNAQGNLYIAGVIRSIAYARVRSAGTTIEQASIDAGVLAAMRGVNIRRMIEYGHMGEMPEPQPIGVEEDAYLSSGGNERTMHSSGNYYLIKADLSGFLYFDPRYEYMPIKYIRYADGQETDAVLPNDLISVCYFTLSSNSSFRAYVYNKVESTASYTRLVYRKSPATLRTAYLNADKTPSTIGSGSTYYLYDENGGQIIKSDGNQRDQIAYYYVNGERLLNINGSGNPIVRMTDSGNRLQIGVSSSMTIEKLEFSTQPVVQ